MLVGPDIRKLLQDEEFYGHLSDMQKTAFDFMQLVISEFLGNSKAQNYAENIECMLIGFNNIEKIGAVSDEHGERFHQDIKVLEERFKGKSQSVLLPEYVWGLYRNLDTSKHSRQAKCRKAY
ncbi:uncharacterized protein LOC120780956 [Bactrocera tryoni]|uniref:uncharacterized protein LOC120780956 n=1 Tax=Bactrocera tryoni TaxID=59916 RepID=UPI001A967591|nr:uncharacterized protein LOC120780956 [Bactrocera tryoni]